MIILKKTLTEVEPIDVSIEKVDQTINNLKNVFNDPGDSCKKALKALAFIWEGIAPREDLVINLDILKTFKLAWNKNKLRPCTHRKTTTIERNCCGEIKDTIFLYHCNKKQQPVTEIGCSKCEE